MLRHLAPRLLRNRPYLSRTCKTICERAVTRITGTSAVIDGEGLSGAVDGFALAHHNLTGDSSVRLRIYAGSNQTGDVVYDSTVITLAEITPWGSFTWGGLIPGVLLYLMATCHRPMPSGLTKRLAFLLSAISLRHKILSLTSVACLSARVFSLVSIIAMAVALVGSSQPHKRGRMAAA